MFYAKKFNAYSRDSNEAINNATEIYAILLGRGWTIYAVCGMLGNVGYESGYNPWRWQGDNVQPVGNYPWTNIGYGLVQFTPASKYISSEQAHSLPGYAPNFSNSVGNSTDGYSQVLFVDQYADYYPTVTYPETYNEFKSSTKNEKYLASAWLYNYERPADPSATESLRQAEAEYWYDILSEIIPPPDPPDPPIKKKKMPLYMYLKR